MENGMWGLVIIFCHPERPPRLVGQARLNGTDRQSKEGKMENGKLKVKCRESED